MRNEGGGDEVVEGGAEEREDGQREEGKTKPKSHLSLKNTPSQS